MKFLHGFMIALAASATISIHAAEQLPNSVTLTNRIPGQELFCSIIGLASTSSLSLADFRALNRTGPEWRRNSYGHHMFLAPQNSITITTDARLVRLEAQKHRTLSNGATAAFLQVHLVTPERPRDAVHLEDASCDSLNGTFEIVQDEAEDDGSEPMMRIVRTAPQSTR